MFSRHSQQVTLLGLLDLSAAFDCVDHQLLLMRLQQNFDLTELRFSSGSRRLSQDGLNKWRTVLWSDVTLAATVARGTAKVSFWPAAVFPVHGWDRRSCRQLGSTTAPVRGRMSALRLHADERRSESCRQVLVLSC